jgi:hypothetical protein
MPADKTIIAGRLSLVSAPWPLFDQLVGMVKKTVYRRLEGIDWSLGVEHLVDRLQVVSLAFADSAFPIAHAEAIMDGIRALNRDLSIFTELRANTPPRQLRKMKRAGVDAVHLGIDALSSRQLTKMNKGARAIDNLSLMKHCEAAGLVNASNRMLHFPSSDDDVSQTLHALDFARCYRPLKTISSLAVPASWRRPA